MTVVSPFGYIPDFVLLGREWVSISSGVTIQTGNVGGFDQSTGVPSRDGFEVVAGPSAIFQGGSQIATHSDRIEASSQAGDVFYVDTFVSGNGAVLVPKVGYVPLFYSMPAVPAFSAGGADLVLKGTQVLPAGTYGRLTVNPNATVTLSGGNYYFTSIEVKSGGRVRFSAASTIHVTGRVLVANGAEVKPTAASGGTASRRGAVRDGDRRAAEQSGRGHNVRIPRGYRHQRVCAERDTERRIVRKRNRGLHRSPSVGREQCRASEGQQLRLPLKTGEPGRD